MVPDKYAKANMNLYQVSTVSELTKQQAERRPSTKGPSEEVYASLMARLEQREEEFRALSKKNEHLIKRQHDLEKITRELHNTMKIQHSMMHEKKNKLAELQKQLDTNHKNDRKKTNTLDSREVAVNEKNDLVKKLNDATENARRMKLEIDQHAVWQKETMAELIELKKNVVEKDSKISKLAVRNNKLRGEIERQREFVEEAEYQGREKDHIIELSQEEISTLHSKVDDLKEEMDEQNRVIRVFEQRFATKGQNILELNARVEQADKVWAKIEEREKKFTLSESTNHLLREENDNLRLEEKLLRSEISELNRAFEQYKLHFAQGEEKVDMAYFLSKMRETVKLNDRIAQLEKIIEEKGYISEIDQAECDLRKKERYMMAGIEAVGQVLKTLTSVLDEEHIEAPRIIGKLEETLLLWTEKSEAVFGIESDHSKKCESADQPSLVDVDDDYDGQDSQNNSIDDEDEDDDDLTLNTAGAEDARCTLDLRNFSNDKKLLEVMKNMHIGLQSIHKEGMSIAADINAFVTEEIQEMANSMDKRDDQEVKLKNRSRRRR